MLWAIYIGTLGVAIQTPQPVMMIGKTGNQVALYAGEEDIMYVSGLREGSFTWEVWQEMWGVSPSVDVTRMKKAL